MLNGTKTHTHTHYSLAFIHIKPHEKKRKTRITAHCRKRPKATQHVRLKTWICWIKNRKRQSWKDINSQRTDLKTLEGVWRPSCPVGVLVFKCVCLCVGRKCYVLYQMWVLKSDHEVTNPPPTTPREGNREGGKGRGGRKSETEPVSEGKRENKSRKLEKG